LKRISPNTQLKQGVNEKLSSRPSRDTSVLKNFSLRRIFFRKIFFARMKAKIIITPKKAVVDPQGITVLKALEHMGHRGIKAVHVGKYLEIELDATDKEAARKSLDEAAHKFLSNPVIEDYRLEIE
jgi:phosphoribosylformylglycinamidine synthase subunit PurS